MSTPLLAAAGRRLAGLVTLNNALQIVGAVFGLWGNYLINHSNATGFLLWMVSNVALVWLQSRMRLWTLVGLHGVYLYLALQGAVAWQQKYPETMPGWVPPELIRLVTLVV